MQNSGGFSKGEIGNFGEKSWEFVEMSGIRGYNWGVRELVRK